MKMKLLGLLAAVTFGLASTASAATVVRNYNVAFTQDGLGDAGADWFGRLSVLCDGSVRICDGSVRTFSAMIGGVTYDTLVSSFPGLPFLFGDPAFAPDPRLDGFVFPNPPVGGVRDTVLQFTSDGMWALSPCDVDVRCGGGARLGTYALTLAPVPLPAPLPLAATGLAALVALRRRRKAA